jgi:triphosphoribosyl-dephospho-CoA synthase
MNGVLFFRSLLSLRHFFFQIALSAIQGNSPKELAKLGRVAEEKMFAITGGVNTHKGAIFALGVICASTAKLKCLGSPLTSGTLQQAIKSDWAAYLRYHHPVGNSNGETVRKKHRLSGARALAMQGYKPVFKVFEEMTAVVDPECYGLLAFKKLLLCIDDTNVVHRTGIEGLQFAREQVKTRIFLQEKQTMVTEGIKLHREFCALNISPGGVADMLGVLYFLKQTLTRRDQ